ncbi:nucleotidyltransferase family protein [Actinomycetaceae bacterium MB13-C1-2]|nr:nucleotidyltransferase family protein [Actinomycetaceae bacterium MB13-C1-2]
MSIDKDNVAPGPKQHKAVILARGLGSRMRKESEGAELTDEQRKAADSGVKAMISIDRPFLDYVISALADADFTDICLVIGPEHDMIRDYYDNVEKSRVTISYAVQEEPLGTADALRAAEEFAAGEPFLVLNSDNYYPVAAYEALRDMEGAGLVGFDRVAMFEKSNIASDRVAAFALATGDEEGRLVDVVEKPSEEQIVTLGNDAMVSMNLWKFTEPIFAAAAVIPKSARGEYEIIDAVRQAMDDGEPFSIVRSEDGVLDMSNRDDIASVAAALDGTEVSL